MAKKKKNEHINLNNGPLKSVTIGEITEKKHGFIGVILLFALFLGIVYFLPNIQKFIQQKFGNNDIIDEPIQTNNEQKKPSQEDEEDNTKYLLSETTEYKVDNVNFTNIAFNEGMLTFKAQNNTDNTIELDKLQLYFLTYDTSNVLLNHVPITGTLNSKQSLDFSFQIKNNANSFEIKKMTEDDYPYFDITEDKDGISRLSCTKDSEKIIYTYKNDSLIRIEHTANYAKTSAVYDSLYATFNALVNTNNGKEGISATISSSDTAMDYKMIIDYNIFNEKIDYKYYVEKDTNPRKANFILESDLFDCA